MKLSIALPTLLSCFLVQKGLAMRSGRLPGSRSGSRGVRGGRSNGRNEVTVSGTITVTNLAPESGTCQTPVWVGIHDGEFDLYDRDVAASPALEAIAEDGNVAPLREAFGNAKGGVWDGVAGGAPICPGGSATVRFDIDIPVTRGTPLYFSYASMVLPSNDAFVANGDPKAHPIFNPGAQFRFETIVDSGNDVLDAGTEINDEIPGNTAFFGQMGPNIGEDENSVVTLHPGFLPVGSGGILDAEMFSNADFTAEGYEMLSIEIVLD